MSCGICASRSALCAASESASAHVPGLVTVTSCHTRVHEADTCSACLKFLECNRDCALASGVTPKTACKRVKNKYRPEELINAANEAEGNRRPDDALIAWRFEQEQDADQNERKPRADLCTNTNGKRNVSPSARQARGKIDIGRLVVILELKDFAILVCLYMGMILLNIMSKYTTIAKR
jgi:hypothetical protein